MKSRSVKIDGSVCKVAVVVFFFVVSSSIYANLLVNGSFEEGSPAPGTIAGSFVTLSPGATNLFGWIVTRGQIEYNGAYPASDGTRCLELDGEIGNGGVRQSFSTEPGKDYIVSFDLSGNYARLDLGPLTKKVRLQAAGQWNDFEYVKPETMTDENRYKKCEWMFTAYFTVTSLEIYSLDYYESWCGPYIDNVVVTEVPEPATLLLLGIGVCWIRRK